MQKFLQFTSYYSMDQICQSIQSVEQIETWKVKLFTYHEMHIIETELLWKIKQGKQCYWIFYLVSSSTQLQAWTTTVSIVSKR